MAEPTVLLIDDDPTLLELLADHLNTAGYRPVIAPNGQTGLRQARLAQPDLVVLDVMMPGMDGWEVCRQLRKETRVPIIMLTAKGEEIDKLRGFRLGVDDYVTKPFSFAELTARVGAVLARTRQGLLPKHQVTSDDIIIDLDNHRVTVDSRPVELTPTEYRLLALLATQSNRTISTEQLLLDVWGPEYAGEVKHVKHYIWSLRQKIEADPGDPQHILTERGFGYHFE
jgi:two-component system, OmpR family, alkaline phosphatase synthesis response regulator PhoP